MSKLNINSSSTGKLASQSVQLTSPNKSWLGNGSRTMTARADVPNTDFRLNFRSSQHSSRPSSGYFSSQQSAQPTVTESQINLSQTSILSEPGLSNELWRYGSRGRDFISKRPRSPNRSAFPSYLFNNVKDGSTNSPLIAASSPVTTTGGLLQKIPDQLNEKCQSVSEFWRVISSRAKLMMMSYETCERIIAGITRVESLAGTLAEVMEQRLHALDKRLNGIFGGLDGLQRNLSNVQISIKEAALESDINRQKEAVRQHHLQTLIDQMGDSTKNFVMMKTMPETLREDMRKLQIELSDAVKKIPGQIAEQIAEMKTDLLRTMKKEFQVAITNWTRIEPQDPRGVKHLSVKSMRVTSESEGNVESEQAISRKAYIQTREVLSQKVSKGPAATERRYPYGATKHTTSCHCKEEPRGKRVPRGKKSTTYLRRNTSSYQPSKENVRQDYGREGDLASEMPPKANIGRPPEALAVSGISGLRSEDPSPRRTLDQMPSEAGWVTVRRSENENRPPLLETYSALTNPDRNILTQTLLLKASNTETQCEPIAEHIINTEEFQTSPLVYLGSKATGNNEKTPQVIELSEDSLDETRLLRQRLRARRRRFHCL